MGLGERVRNSWRKDLAKFCPFCGSDNIKENLFTNDEGWLFEYKCRACGVLFKANKINNSELEE